MTAPILGIVMGPDRTTVQIHRRDGVSDDTWLQIRAEWNADGLRSNSQISIPLERFMARRAAFAERCRRLLVGLDTDQDVIQLVRLQREARIHLQTALSTQTLLPVADVERLLGESRSTRVMRPFQTRDLQTLLARDNGANFSVPGAGKTAVTFAVYESERLRGRVDRLLVIAPLSAFDAWEEEARDYLSPSPKLLRFAGKHIPIDTEVILTNYQRLAASYGDLAVWVRNHKVHVVLDEAHRMKKGWSGEWGTACLNLAYLAERRDILTGTPAPQSPADFVALIDFIWPNEAIRILPADVTSARPSSDASKRVADALRPLFVRTSKSDLALPPVVKAPWLVPLEGLQADIYEALRDNYRGFLTVSPREARDFVAMGRITMYLLEAATNPKLLAAGSDAANDVFRHPPLVVDPSSPLADLIQRYNLHETPRKFVELMLLIKANADLGRKTLVWSNFVRNLSTLERMLARYRPAVIHGGVPAYSAERDDRTRETEIARFRGDADCMVLLANPAAMSEGISLHHDCHDAIYLDRTFNAGQYLQSVDRIHRLGLEDSQETRIIFLLTRDTIDEVVDRRVRVKAERLGEMLDDPNLATVALPNEDDYGDVIDSPEDLTALFAHLRGEDER